MVCCNEAQGRVGGKRKQRQGRVEIEYGGHEAQYRTLAWVVCPRALVAWLPLNS